MSAPRYQDPHWSRTILGLVQPTMKSKAEVDSTSADWSRLLRYLSSIKTLKHLQMMRRDKTVATCGNVSMATMLKLLQQSRRIWTLGMSKKPNEDLFILPTQCFFFFFSVYFLASLIRVYDSIFFCRISFSITHHDKQEHFLKISTLSPLQIPKTKLRKV